MPLEKLWLSQPTLEHHWRDCNSGQQAASWQVSANSAFTWSLLLCNGYQFCSSNVWVFQHRSMHALDMSTIIVLVYLGLKFKWNQLSSNNSCHTSCIHKGFLAGKWPDLMTFKPDSANTLGYQLTDYTGTTLADAITQWCPSGNPVLICIIRTLQDHWEATGIPLEAPWLPTILTPVAFHCTLGSKFQAHWFATGFKRNYHWLKVKNEQIYISSASWVILLPMFYKPHLK